MNGLNTKDQILFIIHLMWITMINQNIRRDIGLDVLQWLPNAHFGMNICQKFVDLEVSIYILPCTNLFKYQINLSSQKLKFVKNTYNENSTSIKFHVVNDGCLPQVTIIYHVGRWKLWVNI